MPELLLLSSGLPREEGEEALEGLVDVSLSLVEGHDRLTHSQSWSHHSFCAWDKVAALWPSDAIPAVGVGLLGAAGVQQQLCTNGLC